MNLREITFGFVSLQSLDEMSHVCYLPTTLTFPLLYQAFSVASFIFLYRTINSKDSKEIQHKMIQHS